MASTDLRQPGYGGVAGRLAGMSTILPPGRHRQRVGQPDRQHHPDPLDLPDGRPGVGKNMFPSNIAGLPTWYTVRANKRGIHRPPKEIDVLVAMNAGDGQGRRADARAGRGGRSTTNRSAQGAAKRSHLLPGALRQDRGRSARTQSCAASSRNMIYDGVWRTSSASKWPRWSRRPSRQLGKKQKALALNMAALNAGHEYAEANFAPHEPLRVERMNETAGKIIIDGNAAAAIGCLMAGVTVVALVSDHAVLVALRVAHRLPAEVPHRQGDREGDVRDRAGRGRDRGHRHGHRRRLGRRARDDVHVGPRHLAHGRVRRPRLLRRSARGHLRHPARRPLDRPADAHGAGRHPVDGRALARRHEAPVAPARLGRECYSMASRRSTWPSGCRRRCSS